MFGGSALRLALDEVGNGTGAEPMEVGDLRRKTLGKKRAYNRRVAGNGCLGQPALLAQAKHLRNQGARQPKVPEGETPYDLGALESSLTQPTFPIWPTFCWE